MSKDVLISKKKRTNSQKDWLLRQINDVYVKKAKQDGYRSRAAYKLKEIQQKYKIINKGSNVIDLGAAPGGWAQVVLEVIKTGKLVCVDLLDMDSLTNATIIKGDFNSAAIQDQIISIMPKADVILSDMAASACGIQSVDHIRIMNLLEEALSFSFLHLNKGGCFVAKVLKGGTEHNLLAKLKQHFKKVFHFKPNSSRKESSEMYMIAINFLAKID